MFANGSHKELAQSLETIGAAFAIFELERNSGQLILIAGNSSFAEIALKPISECIALPLSEIFPRYVEKPIRASFLNCLTTQNPQDDELVIEREGQTRWWRFIASPVLSDGVGKQRIIVTLMEITEKKMLERQLSVSRQRFEAVVETAYDGIITIDEQSKIKLMNEAARSIFRVGDEKVEGSNLSRFLPLRYRNKHQDYVTSFRGSAINARPMQSRVSVSGLRADGSEFPLEVTISKIQVGTGIEMTAVLRDISERAKLIEELSKAANFDALTGLLNRREGTKLITHELFRSQRFDHTFSLAMVDIDNFKMVNDNYGHSCGDKVLISTANALNNAIREIDMVCRWGGEEFLVLLPETPLDEARSWAERLRQLVENQKTQGTNEKDIQVTVSIGLTAFNKDLSLTELIDAADKALYLSKNNGRNQVSFS